MGVSTGNERRWDCSVLGFSGMAVGQVTAASGAKSSNNGVTVDVKQNVQRALQGQPYVYPGTVVTPVSVPGTVVAPVSVPGTVVALVSPQQPIDIKVQQTVTDKAKKA